jgi:hypothetical protein
MTRMAKVGHWIGLLASAALYLFSLSLPTLHFKFHEPLHGYSVLGWGWWGVLTGDFPWFANPAYVVSILWYVRRDFVWSLAGAGAATVLGLLALRTKEWWFHEGAPSAIIALGAGYYAWMASFAVLLLFSAGFALASNSTMERDARETGARPSL